ncbi:MAG: hypothetical protein II200_08545 [Bacteroidaceae bacterium]|nr:hypothetical protein [Bacteroidaceae bacterium]
MKVKDFFMKSRYGFVMLFAACNLMFWGCNDDDPVENKVPDLPTQEDPVESKEPDLPTQQIVVLYDNDVHCTVDGYPMLVTARNECLSRTNYVSTVSSGDFSSGGFVGAVSKGE